jgi:2-polyprenyl-3-methyl-5-hydroxy-6-metoxy-1,4-benzoquinol methylase
MVEFFHALPSRKLVDSRTAALRDLVAGKSVLHVGCVDSGLTQARIDSGRLLHGLLTRSAARVVGIDIDEVGLDVMRRSGFADLHRARDDGTSPVAEQFDFIVAGEVLEHVSAPGPFIQSYLPNLKPDGRLVLTVPNAFYLVGFLRLFRGIETCHEDHVAYYSYVTLRRLFERSGLRIEKLFFYSEIEAVTGLKRRAKWLFNRGLSLFPQFGEGIIVTASRVT